MYTHIRSRDWRLGHVTSASIIKLSTYYHLLSSSLKSVISLSFSHPFQRPPGTPVNMSYNVSKVLPLAYNVRCFSIIECRQWRQSLLHITPSQPVAENHKTRCNLPYWAKRVNEVPTFCIPPSQEWSFRRTSFDPTNLGIRRIIPIRDEEVFPQGDS